LYGLQFVAPFAVASWAELDVFGDQAVLERRGRTAMSRASLSRPVALAIEDGLISSDTTVFDYGCGRGGDVARLSELGISAAGWDPVHKPEVPLTAADVINLGFVVNVIEDPVARRIALESAWSLAERLLVVAARLDWDLSPGGACHGDGIVTVKGTFQKFFRQEELRAWVDGVLGERSVAAAPGILYVFRDTALAQRYLLSRVRQPLTPAGPRRLRLRMDTFEANRKHLNTLVTFLEQRGRLPEGGEIEGAAGLSQRFGSLRAALALAERVADEAAWRTSRAKASDDLLVYLALTAFGGRPKLSDLPADTQLDVRSFFGSFRAGCEMADALLRSAGDVAQRTRACAESLIGKITPEALYVHVSALPKLPPLLRVYEGCARALTGTIADATLVKLHRAEPKVSYLLYPCFDRDPHPTLSASIRAHLKNLDVRYRDFRTSSNPPILHRKETFVAPDYPRRATFARLTDQEVRHGLLAEPFGIGTRNAWNARVETAGFLIAGHRLLRATNGRGAAVLETTDRE
jgi:DNA phosphorothioation-associated putative methyltransferase